ncbi:MAG: outer membrane beta-barrel family protein [Muribaculaceae bacterium]|nr:outer membrane beta-barrel family protein [Muribaculaceae bacterium]
MIRLISFLTFLTFVLYSFALDIKVISDDKPVANAEITCYTAKMDSISSAITDSLGYASINTENVVFLNVQHPDFSEKLARISDLKNNTIALQPAVNLKEVEVSVSNKKKYLTYDSYKLSLVQMDQYANFLDALNLIPNIEVLPSGGLFYKGEANVKLLLDGFSTTSQELSTISKDDILQVDVYDTPTGKYALSGVKAVINIRTKSMITGGNFGMNLSQAFVPVGGYNSAALYYNHDRWRYSVRFNNENKHRRKIISNSSLEYEFDGVTYLKERKGKPSHTNMDNNSLVMSVQKSIFGVYLYKFEAGGSIYHNGEDMMQDVSSNYGNFLASSHLYTASNNFWANGYYEKAFGEKGVNGTLMANLHYKYFNNTFNSSYKEFTDNTPGEPFEDHSNDYRTRYDAYYADLQYETDEKDWGQFFTAISGQYKYNRYVDAYNPFFLRNTDIGYIAQYFGMAGNFVFNANAGFKYQRSETSTLANPYSKVNPQGNAQVRFNILRNLQVALSYDYSTFMPSISQLSETNQWVDTRLIYHGNASLQPYSTHDFSFETSFAHRYVNLALTLSYINSPNQICNQYLREDDYILETIVNLKKYNSLYGRLSLIIKPFGNNRMSIYTRLRAAKNHGEGADYSWNGYTFQWNSSVTYRLKKWTFMASYQYPGKISEGQQIRPRGQYWTVGASFRPVNNLSVGFEWGMPFGKCFKDSEHSVRTSIVHTNEEYQVKEMANYVSLTLSWNVRFGRNQNKLDQSIRNEDTDNGILTK